MTPSAKHLNSILCLAIATHCWAEDNIYQKQAISTTEKAVVEIATALDNQLATQHLNLGLQNCLLNYQEEARYHFQQAIKADESCLLAHVGMLMVYPSASIEYKTHLKSVNTLVNELFLTPAEEWYLSTFLQYIAGDLNGAAQAFKQRAELYRRDLMAACWDIVLNHYAAEQGGNILTRANALVNAHPENPVVHFCRAQLDEYLPEPSANALESARKCVELLPDSPCSHQLYAHLLRRSGRFSDALNSIRNAQVSARNDLNHIPAADAALYRTTCLTEACLHLQNGSKLEALKQSLALCRLNFAEQGEGNTILHWEARTLPLRMLVLQPTAPAGAAINAAAKACNAPADDPVHNIQNCLVAALRTRTLAESGRTSTAAQTLQQAENQLSELQKYAADYSRTGGISLTCFRRAERACLGAVYRARLALYTDSESIWKPYLDELLSLPEPRFLPPVLPKISIEK